MSSAPTEQRSESSAEKTRAAKRRARKVKAKAARRQHAVILPSPPPAVKQSQHHELASAGTHHDQTAAGSACSDDAGEDAISRRESGGKKPGRTVKTPSITTAFTSSARGDKRDSAVVASGESGVLTPKRSEVLQASTSVQSHKASKRARQHDSHDATANNNGSSGRARDDALPHAGSSHSISDDDGDGAYPASRSRAVHTTTTTTTNNNTTNTTSISEQLLDSLPYNEKKISKKKQKIKNSKQGLDTHRDTLTTSKNEGLQQHPLSTPYPAVRGDIQQNKRTSHANNETLAVAASTGPISNNQGTRRDTSSPGRGGSNAVVVVPQLQKEEQRNEARRLSKVLESVRKRHRAEIGKGRPLIGWDIEAFAKFSFERLLAVSSVVSAGGEMEKATQMEGQIGEDDSMEDVEAVAMAVAAVVARAEEGHAGEVTISEFEALLRIETPGLTVRRQAGKLLRQAMKQEQAGDLDAAEARCVACLTTWPGCGKAHLKLAQILKARGASEQRAIRDVEFHLRQALGCASKARERGGGEAAEELGQSAAERLSLLLCQEGKDKEAAKILKRHGFRYRLSPHVLRYPLPQDSPSHSVEQTEAIRDQSVGGQLLPVQEGPLKKGSGLMPEGRENGAARETDEASRYVAAVDFALPAEMLVHLQEAFCSGSRFWSEHGYNSETGTPGYFSYIHSLDKAPSTSVEQVISHLRVLAEKKFPAVKEAKFVEWWAHRRPHSSGHQMHFDSDNEGKGGVRNPIVSLVVYVTGDVGGPTLITTQRLSSKKLADRGWIVHPRVNRVCMFDGGVLHGVIPGRGIPQPPLQSFESTSRRSVSEAQTMGADAGYDKTQDSKKGGATDHPRGGGRGERVGKKSKKRHRPSAANVGLTTVGHGGKIDTERGGRGEVAFGGGDNDLGDEATAAAVNRGSAAVHFDRTDTEQQGERTGMRVTWMVAFWKDIQARQPPPPAGGPGEQGLYSPLPSGAGAAQPFPGIINPSRGGSGCTWPELFRKKSNGWGKDGGWEGGTPVVPIAVPQVWEDVDGENRRMGIGVRRLKRLPEYDLCFQGF